MLPCGSPGSPSPIRAIFPPRDPDRADRSWHTFIRRLIARINPVLRQRSNPRVVKRKYTKWHVKRDKHAHWPQPSHPARHTISNR
ncbi:hypothetical protein BST10_20990 [Mycolicibacter algericus DSM 45454]|uniref:Transposase n=1 Tax=Mycolicibacter algericus DSM 45454 TaxID=723879 RepID=A0ABX3RET1_MYCAL|nr:hypothetical protein BST10_20990 [Mycolicibacter algericus DSM 45454]